MTELELTRRVVETAAKFLMAEPAGVREISISLRYQAYEASWQDLCLLEKVSIRAVRRGWRCSTGHWLDPITTIFYAPKTDSF